MNKKNFKYFAFGVICIGICIGLAFVLQSAYLLFLASIIPIIMTPYLPDIRTNQLVKGNSNKLQIYHVSANTTNELDYVVIQFKPGKIFWNKRLLLFSPEQIAAVRPNELKTNIVALPVLGYDLILRKGKNPHIGIYLKHLVDRSRSFSFTIGEVNRLIISVKDMNELLSGTPTSFVKTAKQSKQLHA